MTKQLLYATKVGSPVQQVGGRRVAERMRADRRCPLDAAGECGDERPHLPLAEIGRVLGVTESRICQMHTKAVIQLRAKMATQH